MNLQTIAEHTVDMDLLPEYSNIIDIGARGFEFADYFINHNVVTIDADPDIKRNGEHYTIAITNYYGYAGLKKSSDPQATHLDSCDYDIKVPCCTLNDFCIKVGVLNWDLIKLDIESSEYEVIMSMDRPYATQITVEFHLHCGQTEAQVKECVDKLHSLGYRTIQHEKTPRHGLKANYWDSLFCL